MVLPTGCSPIAGENRLSFCTFAAKFISGMYRKRSFYFLCLAITVVLYSCGNKEQTIMPIRKDITQAVYASGKLFPLQYHKVVSTLPGYIEEIYVKVGDQVAVGTPLFKVKNEASGFSLQAAQNSLALAREYADPSGDYLRTFIQDKKAALDKFKLDSLQFARYANLRADGGGTQQQYDNLKTQLSISKETYNKAKAAYAAAVQKTKADYENALNAVNAAQTQKSDYIVKSNAIAEVFDVIGKVGEFTNQQTPVMELGSPSEYEVELAIDETDLNFIFEGQEVVFNSEAFGDKVVFSGKIKQVYPKITQNNKSIKATASINLPAKTKIYAGSTIEANIIYRTVKNALVIPKVYFRNDSVAIKDGLSGKKVAVKTGAQDVEFIEILEGIKETDVLVKPK